jgi:integrase
MEAMAYVEKRGENRYRARYRGPDGRERSKTFRTKRDATRWLTSTASSVYSGTYTDPQHGKQRFHDFALEWAEAQDWKDTTRESFPLVLARAEVALPNDVALVGIDELVVKRARVALAAKYKAATVDLTFGYIVAILRAAHAMRRISIDPTARVQGRRRGALERDRVGPQEVPTRAEVAAIWAAAPSKYRPAIALGASGMRIGEVLGLTADRVDVEERLVTIDRQRQRIGGVMQFTPPKGGRYDGDKARTIRVPSAVALELRRHLRDVAHDELLFYGVRGADLRRDQFYASAWRPALNAAGLASNRYVFHALRHFCASSMLAEGVNPVAVAGHLGDTLETLQRVYAHWMRDDRDVPADALERILVIRDDATSAAYPRPARESKA